MLYWTLSLLIILTGTGFWLYKRLFPAIIKQRAQADLYKVIFPKGEEQKQKVLEIFHEFTNHRFNDEQILDYFIKIKGLQNLSVCVKTSFWIRRYLLSPTDIKLNYFEQVRFYEMFINYPKSFDPLTLTEDVPANGRLYLNNEPAKSATQETRITLPA